MKTTKEILYDLRCDWRKYNSLSKVSKDYSLAFEMIADYLAEKIELYSK